MLIDQRGPHACVSETTHQLASTGAPGRGGVVPEIMEMKIRRNNIANLLYWWVKERQHWFGRVRDLDGRQWWIKAVDLRPAGHQKMILGSYVLAADMDETWQL
jgi:hypothetical protein